eukprot:4443415-Pyramimonas_sp.AAC.1
MLKVTLSDGRLPRGMCASRPLPLPLGVGGSRVLWRSSLSERLRRASSSSLSSSHARICRQGRPSTNGRSVRGKPGRCA